MSVIILQDEIVHYEVLGRGRPVVFLHGWVGSWRYWIPAMQAASISYRTYALDLWGFGDSAKVEEYYTLDQQVSLVEQFLQALGIGKIALVGHGLGAIVAFMYANRQHASVDRVLAVGMPAGGKKVHPRLSNALPQDLAEWLLSRTEESEPARNEAQKTDPKAIQLSFSDLDSIEWAPSSQDLLTPCLLIYGQNDPLVGELSYHQEIPSPTNNTHKILFEQSGHFPMIDEPRKFNRLLTDFLALESGANPSQLQLKEEWKRRVR